MKWPRKNRNRFRPVCTHTIVSNHQVRCAFNCFRFRTGGIHKPRRQEFCQYLTHPCRQVYYLSLCCSIDIWLAPFPLACLRSLWMPPNGVTWQLLFNPLLKVGLRLFVLCSKLNNFQGINLFCPFLWVIRITLTSFFTP